MPSRVSLRAFAGAALALLCSIPMASITACGDSEQEGAPSPGGDAGPDAPPAEPPPPVPYTYRCADRVTEDACLPTVRAYCRRLFACDAWKGGFSQGDETLCVNNLTADCVARHGINGKAADGERLAAGAKVLESLACTDVVGLNYGIFFGLSQPGEPCDVDGVCLRSSCSAIKDGVQKGTCQIDIFPKDGEPCLLGTTCDYGHYCAIRGGDCRKAGVEGERCNTELSDPECGGAMFCERPAGQDGHCQRWLEPGAACDPVQARCVGGAICDAGSRTCALIPPPVRQTIGQACDPSDDSPIPRPGKESANRCSIGEFCAAVDGSAQGKCRLLLGEGVSCEMEGPSRCLGALSCSSASGEPQCRPQVCDVVVQP